MLLVALQGCPVGPPPLVGAVAPPQNTGLEVVKPVAFEVAAVEVRVVEEVEEVHRELDPQLLLDHPILGQLAVHVGVRGPETGAARRQIGWECADRIPNQREMAVVHEIEAASPRSARGAGSQGPLIGGVAGSDQ